MNTEYQKFQKNTEVKDNFDLKYMALGLGGEVGEVQNEIKKLERDDNNILSNDRRKKIINELGDVMWYLTGICSRINCSIDDILKANINKLKTYNATVPSSYPSNDSRDW